MSTSHNPAFSRVRCIGSDYSVNRCFKASDWSNELKAQTRELIDSGGPIGTPDGNLNLRHIDGGFGSITMLDLAWAVLKIVDRHTNAKIGTFANVDDLIAAGWAVD